MVWSIARENAPVTSAFFPNSWPAYEDFLYATPILLSSRKVCPALSDNLYNLTGEVLREDKNQRQITARASGDCIQIRRT